MTNRKLLKIALLTPLFILLSHYLTVLPHTYAHSIMAWFLGYKSSPFAITWGHFDFSNFILLSQVHENFNYNIIKTLGQTYYLDLAIIALAGPVFANGFLFLLSLIFLRLDFIRKNVYLFYFTFWFSFINLCTLYSYVPIRTFNSHGDMANIAYGLSISPWFIYTTFGYPIALFIWHFFTDTLIQTYIVLDFTRVWSKAILLCLCIILIFGYFGMTGLIDNGGDISRFLSVTSLIMIPGWIIACWPTRLWVKRQMAIPRLSRFGYSIER